MSKITVLNERSIAVEVPSMAFGFDVNNYGNSSEFMYMVDLAEITDDPEYKHDETLITIALPPGSWSILGRPEEITEEQWKGIVEKVMPFGKVERFKDYEYPESAFYEAKTSGGSLLKSKGLNPSEIIILIKQ